MSKLNRYIAQQIAVIAPPIAYPWVGGNAATVADALLRVRQNIDLLTQMLSLEGADSAVNRVFMDEMTPQARLTMIRTLEDMRRQATN